MSNIVELDQILYKYFSKSFRTFTSHDNSFINFLVIILRLIHIVGILFLFFGFLLPSKFRDYHIIFTLKSILLWYIFDNKCYITILINLLKGNSEEDYEEFLPLSYEATTFTAFLVLTISLYSLCYPDYSPFNLIKDLINYLDSLN